MKKTKLAALLFALCLALCSCRSGAENDPGRFFSPGARYPLTVSTDDGKLSAEAVLELGENGSARLVFAEGFEKRFENGVETDVLDEIAFPLERHSAFYELILAAGVVSSGKEAFSRVEKEDGTLSFVWESKENCGRITLICLKDMSRPLKMETNRLTAAFSTPEVSQKE